MTPTRTPRGFLQRFLVLFLPCAVLLGGLVFWIDAASQRSERTLLEQSESLAIALAHTALAHEFQEVVADVRLLADSAQLQWVLENPHRRPDRLVAEYLALSRYRRLYDQVRFLDATGMEIVRVDFNNGQPAAVPKADLQNRRTRSYFSETLALPPGTVFVSPFERNIEQEQVEHPDQPMIAFGAPVVDRHGRKRGIVVLNYDGTEFFAALARATAPAVGQVVLLNVEGAWLRGPRLESEWGGAVSERTFAQAFPAVWARIRAEEVGQFITPEGLFTFTTIHPLTEAEASGAASAQPVAPRATEHRAKTDAWKLASRVAPAVLASRLRRPLQGVLPLALLALGGLAVGTTVLARIGLKHAKAEHALQASEGRLRDLLDTVHLAAVMLDPAGRVTYVNEHLCQVTGWAASDLLGQDWGANVVSPETPDVVRTLLRGAITGGEIPRYNEYRIRSRDGRQRLIVWANAVLRDPDGQVVGIASFGRDITEHRAADVALAESEERFRAAVDALPAEFIIYDAERRLQYINAFGRRVAASMGVSDPLGKRDDEIFPPEATAGFLPHLERAYTTRQAQQFEWTQPAALGGRTLVVHYVPLRAEGGPVRQMLGIVHDITARKQAEEALRQAQKLEAVGRLAGGVAHDFNNILTATLARLDDLQADPTVSAPVRSELVQLEQDALRAAALIRQLLVFSRRQVATMKPLEVNQLLVNLLKMLYRVLGEHIRLEFSADPTELWVTGDAGMLEQVVTNLAVNARDAMPQGGRLTVRTHRARLDAEAATGQPGGRPGTFVCLTVTDTGCGMDTTMLPRIFEPFFTTKEVGRGTGLGLATVYGIVAQHQGWISVESAVGQGSTFQVFLPLAETRASPREDVARGPVGGHETLLLVEDEPTVRKPMAGALRRLGYHVLEAGTGPEALAVWAKHRDDISVLISDVVMPEGLTGVELAARLRAERPTLQIILASGYSEELAECSGSPVVGITYLAKPFRPSDVANTVRACLDRDDLGSGRVPEVGAS
jgi:PAS domain S-box-containing protein